MIGLDYCVFGAQGARRELSNQLDEGLPRSPYGYGGQLWLRDDPKWGAIRTTYPRARPPS